MIQKKSQFLNLRWRLLLLNLASAGICLSIFTGISHYYKRITFPERIHEAKDANGSHFIEQDLGSRDLPVVLALFQEVNNEGTLLGLIATGFVITGLTYLFSCSLNRPLQDIGQAVERFNTGDFSARAQMSCIPEINQLCITLNSAASRLQDVDERRRALVDDLTHELGTPLTVIRGYLELIQDGKIQLTEELTVQLLKESHRMNRLLGDLQTLFKVEAGVLPLYLRPCSPTPIIKQLVTVFSIQCQQSGKTLFWQSKHLPQLYADPDRFSQILTNLLSNAVRYTPEGGVITVTSRASKQLLWITVSDTGIGMSAADLTHVFERFWRSPSARTMHRDGSGLGLSITKRLIEMQGGTITAEGSPGQGCVFQFSLPLA